MPTTTLVCVKCDTHVRYTQIFSHHYLLPFELSIFKRNFPFVSVLNQCFKPKILNLYIFSFSNLSPLFFGSISVFKCECTDNLQFKNQSVIILTKKVHLKITEYCTVLLSSRYRSLAHHCRLGKAAWGLVQVERRFSISNEDILYSQSLEEPGL